MIFDAIRERLRQGKRTHAYPKKPMSLPERLRGRPVLKEICSAKCEKCLEVCPTNALLKIGEALTLDLGKCIFCGECERLCPEKVITFSTAHELASSNRKSLIINDSEFVKANALSNELLKLFGRSLKLRQVSAGGCNACEADTNVLNTLVWDLGRFGIQFVASPRHADGLFITGPITKNMELALRKTYDAIPDPKIVIATGACAISGGLYAESKETLGGVDKILPVDLYIPGCPPHPLTILDGLLRLIKKGAV